MKPEMAKLIRESAAVPSIPQVVQRFLEVISDPNFDYSDVVKILSVDAGTVSEILRLANSALFGVSRKVTSLKQALTLLGPRRTRSLVLGRFLVETVGGDSAAGGVDRSYFWRRSLACGVIAARVADKLCPRHRDEVFLSALLADVGVTILAEVLPEAYADFAANYAPYGDRFDADAEQRAVDTSHCEVSAMVLAEWQLPEPMCRAVAASHDDTIEVTDEASQMARVINSADRIAKLLCEIPDVEQCVRVCTEAMDFVGVELSVLINLLADVEKDVEELAAILRIDVIPSNVYGQIAQAVREKLTPQPAT